MSNNTPQMYCHRCSSTSYDYISNSDTGDPLVCPICHSDFVELTDEADRAQDLPEDPFPPSPLAMLGPLLQEGTAQLPIQARFDGHSATQVKFLSAYHQNPLASSKA